jgi:hypothetical protein
MWVPVCLFAYAPAATAGGHKLQGQCAAERVQGGNGGTALPAGQQGGRQAQRAGGGRVYNWFKAG